MILANDFKRQWSALGPEMLEAFRAVGESGWYILGQEVKEFEAALASSWGLGHAVGVASGLDAIEIGLRILGCGAGDRVLTTPISAFATTLAITRIGAIPVFVDCLPNGLIDLEKCRSALAADSRIRYFVPVHLYGHCLDLDALRSLREEFGLKIVEDCAQSVLASFGGHTCGTVGDLAATSFYPTKNLGALGDGGALLTNSADYAVLARSMRDYGQSAKYRHEYLGYNSRLDEMQAALMRRVFLPKLRAWTERRREVAARYLKEIRNPAIRVGEPSGESVWHLFPVFVAAKASLLQFLKEAGVAGGEHYPTSIPSQPAMRDARYEVFGDLRIAEELCASEVSLPIHPFLTDEESAAVIDACNRWTCSH